MIKLIRTLAPEDGSDFEDILSFVTESYMGVWNHGSDSFVLFAASDIELNITELPRCRSLDELDNAVYKACEEHIEAVSRSCAYEFKLIEREID